MRGKRNLVWIPLVAMLVFAMAGIGTSSPGPSVYVTPTINSAPVGSTFNIRVKANDVENLFVTDVRLNFNPGIIELVDDPTTEDIEGIYPCPDANSLEVIYVEQYGASSPSLGWLAIATGRPTGVKTGLSGNVGIAGITFRVKALGDSNIHFYAADLRGVGSGLVVIEAPSVDGKFVGTATSMPKLWIQSHGAGVSFAWKSAKWTAGLTNTFTAKIVNTGTASAEVMVKFRVEGPIEDTVSSTSAMVPAGGSATVSAVFSVDLAGKYTAVGEVYLKSGTAWLSWVSDTQGLGGDGLSRLTGNAFKCK